MSGQLAQRSEEFVTNSEVPDIITDLKVLLDSFRLPDERPYRELEGSERAAIPSIRKQVFFLAHCTAHFAIAAAREATEQRADTELNEIRLAQVSELAYRGLRTHAAYRYREDNHYASTTKNPLGGFVSWSVSRAVRPHFYKTLALYPPKLQSDPEVRRLAAQSKGVGLTAATERFNAKLGLACMSSFDTLAASIHTMKDTSQALPTPDVLGTLGDLTAVESFQEFIGAAPDTPPKQDTASLVPTMRTLT